jgi:hypothetical protein
VNVLFHLGIRERQGLGRIRAALQQPAGIQLRNNTARRKADSNGRKA